MSTKRATGITVKKNENFSEWYSQAILKSGLVDYAPVKGFIVLRPYGYALWESIKCKLDATFKETGHQNAFLPTLIPESLLAREEHHFSGFTPEVFWVTKAGDNQLSERLALRPTSETLAYSLFSKWIASYRDLPLKINFWNTAVRAEIKATKPFIRNSEFLWQEGHTVHSNEKEAEEEVMLILEIYQKMIEDYLAIPTIRGLKSNKEKFVGAEYTTTLEGLMTDGKALQMATSHHLGQNFSKPFEIKFLGKDSHEHFAWQTSWGVSWRLIGAIVMVHGDDKGIIMPPKVAPIQVIIIPIFRDGEGIQVKSKAFDIANELKQLEIRVQVDDRDEYTSGWKFNEWEVQGVPLRINIGPKDIREDRTEFVRRDTGEKVFIKRSKVSESAILFLEEIQKNLISHAKKYLEENVTRANNYDDLKSILENRGGFVLAGWCGDEKCEITIKEETGADIRVIPFEPQEKSVSATCVYCGQQAKMVPIFAKAY